MSFAAVRRIAEGTTTVNQNRVSCGKNEKQRVALARVENVQFERTTLLVRCEKERGHRKRRGEQDRKTGSLDPLCWNGRCA
jgi:hypothetical protein